MAAPCLLPSGRSIFLHVQGTTEEVEVRSPTGQVEIRLTLTESGPILHLAATRIELEATDAVAVRCRRFEVHSDEMHVHSASEMRLESAGDIHLNGDVIRLNC